MKTQTRYPFRPLKSALTPAHSFARLMRPTDVDEATIGQPANVHSAFSGRWSFCAAVSAEMFEVIRYAVTEGAPSESNFPVHLSLFRSSTNREPYAVITHQVKSYQHRILMHLADPAVQMFFDSVSKEKLNFVFSERGTTNAVLLPSPLQDSDFHQAAQLDVGFSESRLTAFLELPWLLQDAVEPSFVPTLIDGQAVRNVWVSLLFPAALESRPSVVV